MLFYQSNLRMQKTKLCLLIVSLLLSSIAFSQDANYWNNQYSAGGYFLPGSVVANNSDSGVLYINPALLVNSKITLLSANATIYHADKIKIKDGAGKGFDLKSSNAGAIPTMVSGNFRLPFKNKNIIIAYGIIQPPSFSYAASQRRDEKANVLNDSYSPGDETFVGQYLAQNDFNDFRLVASAGWKLSNKLSIGVTLEGSRLSHEQNFNYYARAIVNPGAGSSLSLVGVDASYYVSFTNLSLTPKIGFAFDDAANHFGLLLTSPSLHIGGKGLLLSDNTINNIDITGTGQLPISLFANTRQDKLPVKYKTPLSIAVGYTHDFNQWQLYCAGEYFLKVNENNIITPRPDFFIRPDTGNSNLITPDLLKLKDARKAVMNVALGANYKLSEKYTLYAAARTDFTYAGKNRFKDSIDGFIPNTSAWDIYHLQLGINLKKARYNLRAGIYSSIGSTKNYKQEINFNNPSESNFLMGNPSVTKASYFSIGLLVSYIHNFK